MLFTKFAPLKQISLRLIGRCSPDRFFHGTSLSKTSNKLWRSFFYVPGDRPKMIKKMSELCLDPKVTSSHLPDLIVLDCEDAVALDQKLESRKCVSTALSSQPGGQFSTFREKFSRLLVVRINALDSEFAQPDLETILDSSIKCADSNQGRWPGPDLICLPKVEEIEQLRWLSDSIDKILTKLPSVQFKPSIGMVAMIESCKAIVNLNEICQTAKNFPVPLVGIVFGSDDYCASLGVERSDNNAELGYPRQYVPVVAKAHNLASIDMVDIDFKGKQTIHPAQLPIVNMTYSPSDNQIKWAQELLTEALKYSDGDPLQAGAFNFRGHMIDRPTIRQAQNITDLAKLINTGK